MMQPQHLLYFSVALLELQGQGLYPIFYSVQT